MEEQEDLFKRDAPVEMRRTRNCELSVNRIFIIGLKESFVWRFTRRVEF